MSLRLYSYFRSSAAFRVRIALHYKGLPFEYLGVNLLKGEQRSTAYTRLNPQGLVPALEIDNGLLLNQSSAILEWLEETYPEPALLPRDSWQRAKVRSWCNLIACEVHPLNNLRVQQYLSRELQISDEQKQAWISHWMAEGFQALEQEVSAAPFCLGENLSLADLYLIPQIFNALRFKVDMNPYPKLMAIFHHCQALPAFAQAWPDQQPDAI
ncbi:maleylacetoacetate isomerase [Balneatrix alpica]|uniref:Maleylacetoacetate isomerase n=1 Tax=Balneatrix alpica TaxID=75684 RepID=A0ABV5Z8H5_9GAMM|nr:maleylacetoacetate isomerase [Balneatrix alpica]